MDRRHLVVFLCFLGPQNYGAALMNLALGRPTRQISNYLTHTSDRAVDGDNRTSLNDLSCAHTSTETEPWWAVDLGDVRNISEVIITNRADCCSDRLRDFDVLLAESGDLPSVTNLTYKLCGHYGGIVGPGISVSIPCDTAAGNQGKIVMVQLKYLGVLTICEVQVIADETSSTLSASTPTLQPSSSPSSSPSSMAMTTTQAIQASSSTSSMASTTTEPSISTYTTTTNTLTPTSTSADPSSTAAQNDEQCVCRCGKDLEETTQEEAKHYMDEMKTNLTVAKNTTSQFMRKFISIPDDRPSAKSVGLIGLTVCASTLGLLVMCDCVGLIQHYKQLTSIVAQ